MYNNEMILSDHTTVMPGYLSMSERVALKNKLSSGNLHMYCCCSLFMENKLEYGISSDGRFYPLHKNYKHNKDCVRGNGDKGLRNIAYVNKDDGTAVAFLKFNIANFSVPKLSATSDKEDRGCSESTASPDEVESYDTDKLSSEEESVANSDDAEEITWIKPPFDALSDFVYRLNNDTYQECVQSGKGLLPVDYFNNTLFGRLKKVYIDGINVPVRDLSLEAHNVAFFYCPLVGYNMKDGGCHIITKGYQRNYSSFTFEAILRKELMSFEKRYGISLDEALESNYNVMISGLKYLRLSRKMQVYRVVGRMHIFIVNSNGLYCRSLEEVTFLNNISAFMRERYRYKPVSFNRFIDGGCFYGSFTRPGRVQVVLACKKVPKNVLTESDSHVILPMEHFTTEELLSVGRYMD